METHTRLFAHFGLFHPRLQRVFDVLDLGDGDDVVLFTRRGELLAYAPSSAGRWPLEGIFLEPFVWETVAQEVRVSMRRESTTIHIWRIAGGEAVLYWACLDSDQTVLAEGPGVAARLNQIVWEELGEDDDGSGPEGDGARA